MEGLSEQAIHNDYQTTMQQPTRHSKVSIHERSDDFATTEGHRMPKDPVSTHMGT